MVIQARTKKLVLPKEVIKKTVGFFSSVNHLHKNKMKITNGYIVLS